ncbi:MAG: M1 family aminopeptidase [Planctomycetota bacterium]|nr:M1 family aminopeptidase [Planctomycetota bacterium]
MAPVLLILSLVFLQEPATSPVWTGYDEQDALRYELSFDADFDRAWLSGSARITVKLARASRSLRLDLRPSENWSVRFEDPAGNALEAARTVHQVIVALGREAAAGEEVTVVARMEGLPELGLVFAESRDGARFLVADPFGTNTRHWLPCEDFVGDRASWRIELRVPRGIEAIGAGDWRETTNESDATRSFVGETRADLPPTLFAFAAGPWERVPEAGDPRLRPHYVYAADLEIAAEGLGHHAEWMKTMERTFGPYAWEKYTTAQVPTRWGGVEYPGNVWLEENIYRRGDRGVGTLAHEFVHMWFGDGVGYASWEHAWISEGFASYFGPWLHAESGGLPLESHLAGARRAWLRGRNARRLPVIWKDYPFPDALFQSNSSNTYQKGSWVLHMLRDEVGDEAFFGGISAWYQEHRGGVTITDTLRAAVEAKAERDLAWFFTQWLELPNCPTLQVEPFDGGVAILQVQAGDPFRFPLELAWKDASGAAQTRRIQVSAARTEVPLDAGWSALELDPRVKLLFEAR